MLVESLIFCGLFSDGPFTFMVLDASKVTARGDGLSLVRVGTPSRFLINAPNAHVNDFEVKIFSKYLSLAC